MLWVNIAKYLKNNILFKSLEEDQLKDLVESMTVQKFSKCKIIEFNENINTGLYIVLNGVIKLVRNSIDGKETLLDIYDKDDFIYCNFFNKKKEQSCIGIFVTDAQVLHIPYQKVQQLLKINNNFALAMLDFVETKCSKFISFNAEIIKSFTTYEKIGWFLLQQKNRHSKKLPYPKAIIAEYLGITAESLSRGLAKFKKEKIIEMNGNLISIINKDFLCQFCESSSYSDCDSPKKHDRNLCAAATSQDSITTHQDKIKKRAVA